jgi:hypothetical protein
MAERSPSEKAEHMRLLRARADELRDTAAHMKSREARSTLMILAQSYDRMADEMDRFEPRPPETKQQAKA